MRDALRDPYLYTVALAQLVLCFVAFRQIVLHPAEAVLYADYDGGKNYFTPYSYLTDLGRPDVGAHPLKVYGQHYPFGEYVFYTDNTPAVSLPAKLATRFGLPALGGVGALSYTVVGFMWAAAAVLYLLLRNWMRPRWLAALLSVSVVWGCKQYWHLTAGTPNLSLIPFTLGLIGLCWRSYLEPLRWRWWLAAGLLIAWASWFHLYYLIVYGTTLALFAVGLLARAAWSSPFDAAKRAELTRLAVRAAAAGGLALVLVYVPLALIDDKLGLRTGEALGFNYDAWRIDVRSLLTPHPEHRSRFIVSHATPMFGESSGYLGLWFLYGAVLLAAVASWRGWGRSLRAARALPHASFFALLFGVGTLCFFASLGTVYRLPGGEWEWQVIVNPFYPLVKAVPALEQFRAVARFFFVTTWAWGLPLCVGLGVLWRRSPAWGRLPGSLVRVGVLAVVSLAALDARDVIRARKRLHPANLVGGEPVARAREALGSLDPTRYQALAVWPYYHAGSATTGLEADPAHFTIQREGFTLAAATRLPLLNAITSRTPPHEARALLAYMSGAAPSDSLRAGLDARPVLVAVHREAAAAVTADGGGYYVPPGGLARESVLATAARGLALEDTLAQVGPYTLHEIPALPE